MDFTDNLNEVLMINAAITSVAYQKRDTKLVFDLQWFGSLPTKWNNYVRTIL